MSQTRNTTMQQLQDSVDAIQQTLVARKKPFNLQSLRADQDFFYGRSGENFNLWLDRFNRYAQAAEWTEEYKRQLLPKFLRGAAEVVFGGIPADERADLDFDQVVAILRTRFSPAHSSEIKSS